MIVSNKKKIRFEYDFKIGSERLEKKEKAKPQKSMLKRYVSDFMFFWK